MRTLLDNMTKANRDAVDRRIAEIEAEAGATQPPWTDAPNGFEGEIQGDAIDDDRGWRPLSMRYARSDGMTGEIRPVDAAPNSATSALEVPLYGANENWIGRDNLDDYYRVRVNGHARVAIGFDSGSRGDVGETVELNGVVAIPSLVVIGGFRRYEFFGNGAVTIRVRPASCANTVDEELRWRSTRYTMTRRAW